MSVVSENGENHLNGTIIRATRRWIVTLAIAFLPLAVAQSSHWKRLPFIILTLTGLWLICRSAAIRHHYHRIRSIVYAALSLVLITSLSVICHSNQHANLGLYPQTLLFLAIAAAFLLPVNRTAIWLIFSATGAFLGGVAWFQCYINGQPRPYGLNGGPWAAIEFGMFLFALALLTLNQMLSTNMSRLTRLFHAVCCAITVYGGVLTESRGPILAFPVMLCVLSNFYFRQTQGWQVALRHILLPCCLGFVVMIALKPPILSRFFAIIDEVESYNPQNNASGAIRERIEMWRASLIAVKEHPLLGVGTNNFGFYIQQQVDRGNFNPSIRRYRHPHNEYLEAAATAGIPGLLALLSLFLAPLRYFRRFALDKDPERASIARSGILLVGLYMLCGLSDNVFYHAMSNSLYLFLVLGFAMWVSSSHTTVPWQKSTS